MNTIAETDYYLIQTDLLKNRLYLTLVGYWESFDKVPHYLKDLGRAIGGLTQGFTVLSDVTGMKAPPEKVVALHVEAQKVCLDAGLRMTAEIVGHDVITQMATSRFSQHSGMVLRTFENRDEGEAWLNA